MSILDKASYAVGSKSLFLYELVSMLICMPLSTTTSASLLYTPQLPRRIGFGLFAVSAIYLFYAIILLVNWYGIHAHWTEVQATFLRSEVHVPIRRDLSTTAKLSYTYNGVPYQAFTSLSRRIVNPLLAPHLESGDVRTVSIKVRPESPADVIVDPWAVVRVTLSLSAILSLIGILIYKKAASKPPDQKRST